MRYLTLPARRHHSPLRERSAICTRIGYPFRVDYRCASAWQPPSTGARFMLKAWSEDAQIASLARD